MAGSIHSYDTKKGKRYMLMMEVGESGKRKQKKKMGFKTYEEAQEKLNEINNDCQPQYYNDPIKFLKENYEDDISLEIEKLINEYPSVLEDYIYTDDNSLRIQDFFKEAKDIDLNFLFNLDINLLNRSDKKKLDMSTSAFEMRDIINDFKLNIDTSKLSEHALENILIRNLNLIEKGMTFVSRQVRVEDGVIDILARDKKGILTIIELKVVDNCKDIVFQAAYYPTQFKEKVRMITIAPDYTNKIYKALTNTYNGEVEIYGYTYENNKVKVYEYTEEKYIVAC